MPSRIARHCPLRPLSITSAAHRRAGCGSAATSTSAFPAPRASDLRDVRIYGMLVANEGADWLLSIATDRRIEGLENLPRVKGSTSRAHGPLQGTAPVIRSSRRVRL